MATQSSASTSNPSSSSAAAASSSPSTASPSLSCGDTHYGHDDDKVNHLRQEKLWMKDPKYFTKIKISPSAITKMMIHSQFGVEKGTKKNGKPIEVMGILIGRPDYEDKHCFIISDAQPLPIEGFETRVIADSEEVINHMIGLGDSYELSRKERFCGWYHTHPFEVGVNSHCFLSSTDISTQLQWQRTEDNNGYPWLAIVIDPLRSMAKGHPELAAFRAYPPEYNAPSFQTPDGEYVTDERVRIEKWGICWNRFYKLEVEYFISTLAQTTLGILKNNFLWQNIYMTSQNKEIENQKRLCERISTITSKLDIVGSAKGAGSGGGGNMSSGNKESGGVLGVSTKQGEALAMELCQSSVVELSKNIAFNC